MPRQSKPSDRPRLIKTKADYGIAMSRIEQLFNSKPGSVEGDELELLLVLVERYEEAEFPIELPDPITAIRFRMTQRGMSPDDLVPFLGSKKTVTELLNGKRKLTIPMIRTLSTELRIPAEVLLQ